VRNLGRSGHRVLGAAIHFAFIRILWQPQFIARFGKWASWTFARCGKVLLEAFRAARFTGRKRVSWAAIPFARDARSLAAQFIRVVEQSGQGFVACLVVGWYHLSQVGKLFLG
jgi:hypothetical protein